MTLVVTNRAFRGFPLPTPPRRSNEQQEASLMVLVSPSERPPSRRTEQKLVAPLMGFVLVCAPLSTNLLRVHSLRRCRHIRPSHRQVTRSRSAGGFSPPGRFTPRRGLGFVAPRSRPGFIAFRHAQSISSRAPQRHARVAEQADNRWR